MIKVIYRPEIDGLRAIAVGAVILYHAQFTILGHQPFKGGFIGVDIFFVISGYLITSIILKELITTGSFSFKYFYERRIRRILPALLFVMLVSLPFAWMYLIPSSFIDFSKSILYSLGLSSNFYFHYSGQQYGAIDGLFKPFLHTWSLSVEEQFYILFPVILLIIFKYFRKYLIHILILGFVISLGLADWGSRNHPSFNFYALPTRAWELLAGSILAYFEISEGGGGRFKYKILNLILPSVGLFLIGHSILLFKDQMFHPSFYTLSPIFGVCLIIWFSHKDEIITKILSTKLFVGIGLISYSLYLWHYPIFAVYRNLDFSINSFDKLLLISLTLILSLISFKYVEQPARNNLNNSYTIFSLIIVFFILIALNFNVIMKEGYKDRVVFGLSEIAANLQGKKPKQLTDFDGRECHNSINGCRFNTFSNQKIYLIGDSHMNSLMFDLKERIGEKKQVITSTINSCIYFPGFDQINAKTRIREKKCNNSYFAKLKSNLLKDKDSIIIFAGRFPLYLSNSYFSNMEGGVEGGGERFTLCFCPQI
jgi:peptidoglycan/LPS O-acetylase OafA/YrhL